MKNESLRRSANSSPARRARWAAMVVVAAAFGLMAGPATAFRFGETSTIAVGDSPSGLAIHDLNGDGHLDLVVSNFWADTVTVLLGNGTGGFTSTVAYSVSTTDLVEGPGDLAFADFDENGTLDIAVNMGTGYTGVFLLFGDGTGAFTPGSLLDVGEVGPAEGPVGVEAADLDGDGHVDLVTCNRGTRDLSVLLGQGDGTFAAPARYALGAFGGGNGLIDFKLADLNGDGHLDAAVANDVIAPAVNHLMVRLGNGDGTFGELNSFTAAGRPFSLEFGDIDEDGDPDAVMPIPGIPSGVGVLLNDGTGQFGSPSLIALTVQPVNVVVVDLDGDGHLDVATTNFNTNDLDVLRGNGDGTFPGRSRFPVGIRPGALAFGDFDEDGSPDLVAANTESDDVSLFLRPDADDDDLSTSEEAALGTDPFDADTDDDALSDGEEVALGTNPLDADSDNDALGDGDEVALGTDPLDADSDDDALGDGDEVALGTDPLDADSDDDGLPDGTEGELGTDPLDPDSDDNGIPDGEDPALIADIVEGLPESALHSGGNRNALLARLASIEQNISEGEFDQALSQLNNLRSRVDGCTPESPDPDSNDWITDSEAQMEVRALIDALIASLEGV